MARIKYIVHVLVFDTGEELVVRAAKSCKSAEKMTNKADILGWELLRYGQVELDVF